MALGIPLSLKVWMKRWHSDSLVFEFGICILPSSCPPPALVKEVLSNVQRLTFYGFLVALSKHHGINQALGKPELAVASLSCPYSVKPHRSWPVLVDRIPRGRQLHHVCLDFSGPDSEA